MELIDGGWMGDSQTLFSGLMFLGTAFSLCGDRGDCKIPDDVVEIHGRWEALEGHLIPVAVA